MTGDAAEADHPLVRQVGHVGGADERQEMWCSHTERNAMSRSTTASEVAGTPASVSPSGTLSARCVSGSTASPPKNSA